MPQPVIPTAQSPHHVSPFSPPAVDTIACPNCGKQVASAFAFCGGCGHRMKGAPGAVAEAAAVKADPKAAEAAIRISVQKMDALLEAVGELAIFQQQVTEGIVTGTRTVGVKAEDSAAPVQVIGAQALTRTGSTDLAFRYAAGDAFEKGLAASDGECDVSGNRSARNTSAPL